MSIDAVQRNPLINPILQPEIAADTSSCKVSNIASKVLIILGLVLMAAFKPLIFATLYLPAIASLVVGVAVFILGLILSCKTAEAVDPTPPAPIEYETTLPEVIVERIRAIEPVQPRTPPHLRIAGATLGQGVANAAGNIGYRTKEGAQAIIRNGFDLNHTAHAEGYGSRGSFTGSTEHACAIVRAVDQHQKHPEKSLELHFAEQMIHWLNHGIDSFNGQYKSLEDPSQRRLDSALDKVINCPEFLTHPLEASLKGWSSYGQPARNGAVTQASVIGSIYYKDLIKVVENTILLTKTTHADPQAIACAVALSSAIALFIQGHEDIDEVEEHAIAIARFVLHEEMAKHVENYNRRYLPPWHTVGAKVQDDFEQRIHGTYETLNLPDLATGLDANKCLGAAFHALRRYDNFGDDGFPQAIRELIGEGGHTHSHAAAAGALIGAYRGHSNNSPLLPGPGWLDAMNLKARALLEENVQIIRNLSERV